MPLATEQEKARLIALYEQLPPDSQHEVLDFADYLAHRYAGQGKLPQTSVDDVAGCLSYDGPAKTIEEMNDAIANGVRCQWKE